MTAYFRGGFLRRANLRTYDTGNFGPLFDISPPSHDALKDALILVLFNIIIFDVMRLSKEVQANLPQ